jgi:hypothetical protein
MTYKILSSNRASATIRHFENVCEALSDAAEMVRQGASELTLSDETTGMILKGSQITRAFHERVLHR